MKNLYLLLFFVLTFAAVKAQDKVNYKKHFVSFRTGYSIPVSNSQVGSPRAEVGKTYVNEILNAAGETVSYSEKNSFGSRGAGLIVSLAYGYMITQNFSFEMDFNLLYTFGFNDAYINRRDVTNKAIYHAEQVSQTTMFRISPMVGVYANENLLIRPYAKFGLIVPLLGSTSVNLSIEDETGISFRELMPVIDMETVLKTTKLITHINNTTPLNVQNRVPTKTDIKAVTNGSFSLGFLGRFGAEYKFKNVADGRLKLFAEMEIQMLTVKAKETVIKEFYSTVNSASLLAIVENQEILDAADIDVIQTVFTEADIPEILKTTSYLTELVATSNTSFDVTNPHYKRDKAYEQLTFRDSYNALAFLVGLKFSF